MERAETAGSSQRAKRRNSDRPGTRTTIKTRDKISPGKIAGKNKY